MSKNAIKTQTGIIRYPAGIRPQWRPDIRYPAFFTIRCNPICCPFILMTITLLILRVVILCASGLLGPEMPTGYRGSSWNNGPRLPFTLPRLKYFQWTVYGIYKYYVSGRAPEPTGAGASWSLKQTNFYD